MNAMKKNGNTYPVGSTVALSRHGSQLSIQEVSCFVNALH